MKKWLCLLLVFLMLCSFIGCKKSESDAPIDALKAGTVAFTAVETVFEEGTEVTAETVTAGTIYERAKTAVAPIAEKFTVFEFNAVKDEAKVQPNGKLAVTFRIPDDYSNNVKIVYVADDGTTEEIAATVNAGDRTVVAELAHFSTYVLIDLGDTVTTTVQSATTTTTTRVADTSAVTTTTTAKPVTTTAKPTTAKPTTKTPTTQAKAEIKTDVRYGLFQQEGDTDELLTGCYFIFKADGTYMYHQVPYLNDPYGEGESITYNGKVYYVSGGGAGSGGTYTISGDTITLAGGEDIVFTVNSKDKITVKKPDSSFDQFKVGNVFTAQ